MSQKFSTQFEPLKGIVSPEEWETRVTLAACYRLMDKYGMTDMIYNHITARIPGTEDLLINLYGLLYKEITASSLVRITVEGEIVRKPDTDYGINASRCRGRDSHSFSRWYGGVLNELWPVADDPNCESL